MNIALFGYGKMGKEIEKIALERGHSISVRLDKDMDKAEIDFSNTDVVIEFTSPDSAKENIEFCLTNNLPVIIGTTGWYEDLSELSEVCQRENSSMLHATNFSLGVNIFFAVNSYLAKIMNGFKDYSVGVTEIHHTQKLDAPSGTGISIAEQIIEESETLKEWENVKKSQISNETTLSIESLRLPDVPGTHDVKYDSDIDCIEIKHTAHNRKGFALGAVLASEWIIGKKGIFTMKDVLNF